MPVEINFSDTEESSNVADIHMRFPGTLDMEYYPKVFE